MSHRLPIVLALALFVCATTACTQSAPGAASAASDDSCTAVFAAIDKTMETAHHVYSTAQLSQGAAPIKDEIIFANAGVYELDHGHWKRSSASLEDRRKHALLNRTRNENRCHAIGPEAVEGEPALRFETHSRVSGHGIDSVTSVWISTRSGLLLRQRFDIKPGIFIDTRLQYDNVQAPHGVE